jgi:succinate dehydrogenase / fumarate reductase cytochrome b subunit
MAEMSKPRPEFRNIHVSQIRTYRLPAAGLVSIAHRITGAVLFLMLPFLVWLFDVSVTSEMSWERFSSLFTAGALGLPGVIYKLIALGLLFAYMVHFFAGLRHVWMDMTHSVSKEQGRNSAVMSFLLAVLVTLLVAARMFGAF